MGYVRHDASGREMYPWEVDSVTVGTDVVIEQHEDRSDPVATTDVSGAFIKFTDEMSKASRKRADPRNQISWGVAALVALITRRLADKLG